MLSDSNQENFSTVPSAALKQSIELAAWENCLKRLASGINAQIFAAFIKPLSFIGFNLDSGEFVISAPSLLIRRHVEENFGARLLTELRSETKRSSVRIKFIIQNSGQAHEYNNTRPYIVVKKPPSQPNRALITSDGFKPKVGLNGSQSLCLGLNPRYTFENFIVGNSNQFCHAAAMRVAEQPGKNYNPLFIYGGVGLGKTHILHAIGNAILKRSPGTKVAYLSSETFTNELIQSLRNAKMDLFKNKMRGLEVLLIDDIQFMCGKERTQEEFFHTFNTLYNAKHQIVITSDKIPQDIPGIEERLQTRFSWGLIADLQAPDFETRVAILNRKAALDSFELPAEVAHYIAENISSNVRELEGALTKLHALSSFQNQAITLSSAEKALRPLMQPKVVRISIADIKKTVADHFRLKVTDIVSKRRTKNLSFPRHIAMYLCRKHTTASYPEIGGQFGGRDHSSVIHAANVVSNKINNDQRLREIVSELEKQLLSS